MDPFDNAPGTRSVEHPADAGGHISSRARDGPASRPEMAEPAVRRLTNESAYIIFISFIIMPQPSHFIIIPFMDMGPIFIS
jgi:hypothetical protein